MKRLNELCAENIAIILMIIFSVAFPLFSSAYEVDKISGFYITCLLSFSIVLIWGYTGIFSFGQAAFYGVGAYTYAIVSMCSEKNLTVLAALAGIAIATIFALILGYFIFYGGVNEIFTGIITLCVSIVCETFIVQTSGPEYTILGVWLGGYNGITKIPNLQIGGFIFEKSYLYYFIVLIVLVVYFAFRKLTRSNTGYALFGVRESKSRSELFGYKTAKIQTLAFAASGGLAGLGGVLFASWGGYVAPSCLSVDTSTVAVVMVALAGRKNVTGALIMTLGYSYLVNEFASSGNIYTNVILGVMLVVMVMFMPGGLLVELFNKLDSLFAGLKQKIAK